jgi:hypothetical protein
MTRRDPPSALSQPTREYGVTVRFAEVNNIFAGDSRRVVVAYR